MSSSDPAEIVGFLTDRWRPILKLGLSVNGVQHILDCHLDTACDDDLVIRDYSFACELGLTIRTGRSAPRHTRTLADGRDVRFCEARASLEWFGLRGVTILVPEPGLSNRASAPDNLPKVLVGLPMLIGYRVCMTFTGPPGELVISEVPA